MVKRPILSPVAEITDPTIEKNVNTSIKNFESVRSDGRIKRYWQPKFVWSRIGIEKGKIVNFKLGLRDHQSDRMDLERMSIQA